MTGRRDARPSSPRPRARWRSAAFRVAAVCLVISAAVFAFCVIAPAYGLGVPMARPGIGISAIILIASAIVLNLTAGDDE